MRILLALFALCVLSGHVAQAQIKNANNIMNGAFTRAGNSNMKPLDDSQLKTLCEQGYGSAFFMYTGARAHSVSCSRGTISYQSQLLSNPQPILQSMFQNIQAGKKTFVHCFNGAHASGLIAAFALRQFCHVSASVAFNYWQSNLGGHPLAPSAVASIRTRLANFSPSAALQLNAEQTAQLCN